ncbi:MAG TPA: replication factor C large subunit [archaeon]|nr:replication factor C large subunit [archaeon]
MLLNKYRPRNLSEIFGQEYLTEALLQWHSKWEKGKALLVWGPTGTGKTAAVTALAKEKNLDLIELSTVDSRDLESVRKVITSSVNQKSLFGKGKLIFIDDVDCFGWIDDDFVEAVTETIEKSAYPVIMTANNAYDRKIRPLLPYCKQIPIKKLAEASVEKRLSQIIKLEKLDIPPQAIKQIARGCEGDMRAALIDLELYSRTKSFEGREKEKAIFDLLKLFFKAQTLDEALKLIDLSDKDLDELLVWIEENVCREYPSNKDRATAYDLLSRVDLFKNKIYKNQNYRYRIYMRNLLAGIPLHANGNNKYTMYNFPDSIRLLSASKESRAEEQKMQMELAKQLHCSKRNVKVQMPYLKQIIK